MVVVVQMTREKEVRMKGEESEYGGRREEGTKVGMEGGTSMMRRNRTGGKERGKKWGWESVWVKMHPQHICKSLAVGYRGGCRERGGWGWGWMGKKKP